jgi:Mn-dependent DtxR family transcriptional regulator
MVMQRETSLPIQLLQMVSYGGIRSTAELGRRLGVSEVLVTMMTEDLQRRGYLRAVHVSDCNTGCAGCGIANSCKLPEGKDPLPLLALTEKGKLRIQAPSLL